MTPEELQNMVEDIDSSEQNIENEDFDEVAYFNRLTGIAVSVEDRDSLEESLHDVYEANKGYKSLVSVKNDFYETLRVLIQNRLKEIKKIVNDPIRRGIEETKLSDRLDIFFNKKIKDEVVQELLSSDLKPRIYSLKELMELERGVKLDHVSGLFKYGQLLLCVGAPKTGKSLLATSLIRASILGGEFLGRETKKVPVLYVQNEESPEDTAEKLESNGLQLLKLKHPKEYEKIVNNDSFWMSKGVDIIVDLETIIYHIEEHDVKVIVVDSLGASVTKKGYTEMNTETMVALYDLQKIAQHYGLFILVTHHKNKQQSGKSHDDALRQIAGFNGIARANDGVIYMEKSAEEGEQGLINLDIAPRSGEPFSMKVKRVEGEAMYWDFNVDSETSLSVENIEQQNKILRILYEEYQEWNEVRLEKEANGEFVPPVHGLSLNKITQMTGDPEEDVLSRLNYMLRTHAIAFREQKTKNQKDSFWVYHYPSDGNSWLKAYMDREDEQIRREEEIDILDQEKIQEFMACDNEPDLREVMNTCEKSDLKRISKKFTEQQYQHFWQTLFPPKYKVGDWVKISELEEIGQIERIEYPKQKPSDRATCHKYFMDSEKFPNQEFREFQLEKAIQIPEGSLENNSDDV